AWLETLSGDDAALRDELKRLLAHRDDGSASDVRRQIDDGAVAMAARLGIDGSEEEPLSAGQRVGEWILDRPLGAGGMGMVWLAKKAGDALLPPVAIKLAATAGNARAAAERLQREGAILAALNHPGIARLIEVGVTDDGAPFLALEYIAGVPLPAHCDQHRLTPEARLSLFVKVLDAVAYAHSTLVLHRDLKPANVLVTEGGEVKLLDFGIAKLIDGSGSAHATQLTRVAGRAMTPDYASPEQIAGTPLTVASDIYSLGVMLFELLTGERPYRLKRGSVAELEEAILSADTSRPSTVVNGEFAARNHDTVSRLRKKLAGDLDTIVLKCLKKTPAERYAGVAALKDDIERFLDGRPVLAVADSAAYRMARFVRRNWLGVSAAAAVVLALVAGMGVALWQARQANEHARIAEQEAARANAVKGFLTSLFERNSRMQADAASARNKTAREILLESSDTIGTAFAGDPILRQELANTVGRLLIDVEEYDRGVALLEESQSLLESRGQEGGEAHIDALATLVNGYRLQGKGEPAVKTRNRAIALLDAKGDRTSLARARLLATSVLQFAPDFKREEALLKESIALFETRYPREPGYFTALFALANAYRTRGFWFHALPYFTRAQEVFAASGSKDHSAYAAAHFWGGYTASQLGKMDIALASMEKALQLARAQMGPQSQGVWFYRALRARTLHRAGRITEAHAEFADLRGDAKSRVPSANDFDVALYQAEAFVLEGQPAKAIAELSPYSNTLLKFGQRFYPNTISWVTTMAAAQAALGDYKAASATLARTSQIPVNYAVDARWLDTYKFEVSGIQIDRGLLDEAMETLRFGQFNPDIIASAFTDGFFYAYLRVAEIELKRAELPGADAAARRKAALQSADRGIEMLTKKSSYEAMPFHAIYARQVHARALKANQRDEEARDQLQQAILTMRALQAPDSIGIARAEKLLAQWRRS
ncbi:MAG: serine/threonine protein kinase, partial [Betaproteobacteria bacterium]|nr:serine/threonine protein kinase [Betaproteobacteria bacterium]